ncbi:threonine--tRNA ligase [Patescibacteria group bacterium]|nr:threonine--tRNA ligase [Patescibacteria group bacterium]
MKKENNNLESMRHSLAHVMMQALENLYQAIPGVGPAIDDGFYHDFDATYQVTDADLPKIEAEMKKIIKQNLKIEKKIMPIDEGIKFLKKKGYKYTAELAQDLKAEKESEISFYEQADFINMCKGPHVESTGKIKVDAFKLTKVAGAYWKGDEKNKMIQRIYGVAFNTKKELADYLEMMEEAEKRDHRKLGQELELFIIDEEVGPGLPLWMPNGAILKQEIEKFVLNEYQHRGYKLVQTPHIASQKLFSQSGHIDFYKDDMYSPMDIDGEDYYVKPMNCPFHVKIFKHSSKSYRDLPVRYTELGTVYRYERSGTLHGLTRARGFTQDDAHIICTPDQLKNELKNVIDLTKYILETFGFEKFKVALSVRDKKNKEKYLGNDKDWQIAEDGLREALKGTGWDFEEEEGEAVFYGPKIDVKVYDAVGRDWQISTIQLDFNLPERFDMNYIDKDSQKKKPFMIHRALLGSLERFTGILIEHFAGDFPVWLSPVQVKLVAVSEKHVDYCQEIVDEFKAEDIRVEVDISDETVGNKIRKAIKEKVPYMLVIGDKEMNSKNLMVRDRGSRDTREVGKEKFFEEIREVVSHKT